MRTRRGWLLAGRSAALASAWPPRASQVGALRPRGPDDPRLPAVLLRLRRDGAGLRGRGRGRAAPTASPRPLSRPRAPTEAATLNRAVYLRCVRGPAGGERPPGPRRALRSARPALPPSSGAHPASRAPRCSAPRGSRRRRRNSGARARRKGRTRGGSGLGVVAFHAASGGVRPRERLAVRDAGAGSRHAAAAECAAGRGRLSARGRWIEFRRPRRAALAGHAWPTITPWACSGSIEPIWPPPTRSGRQRGRSISAACPTSSGKSRAAPAAPSRRSARRRARSAEWPIAREAYIQILATRYAGATARRGGAARSGGALLRSSAVPEARQRLERPSWMARQAIRSCQSGRPALLAPSYEAAGRRTRRWTFVRTLAARGDCPAAAGTAQQSSVRSGAGSSRRRGSGDEARPLLQKAIDDADPTICRRSRLPARRGVALAGQRAAAAPGVATAAAYTGAGPGSWGQRCTLLGAGAGCFVALKQRSGGGGHRVPEAGDGEGGSSPKGWRRPRAGAQGPRRA